MKLVKAIWASLNKLFGKAKENIQEQKAIDHTKENKVQIENRLAKSAPTTQKQSMSLEQTEEQIWWQRAKEKSNFEAQLKKVQLKSLNNKEHINDLDSDLESPVSRDEIQQPNEIYVPGNTQSPVVDNTNIHPIDLVIGFDFGTSTSKVVIQAPDLQGSPARAVNFGNLSLKDFPYLIPTTIWINEEGETSLLDRDDYNRFADLKIRLLPKVNSGNGANFINSDAAIKAICYLANVLQISRRWFLAENINLIGHRTIINWSFNLGVPSPCIEDNDENTIFNRIGRAAWILSVSDTDPGFINLKEAATIYESLSGKDEWPDKMENALKCEFSIIPEIAAGAIGYALSDQRRNGLHMMVDIGAGTVDVCMFILGNTEISNRYSLLTADVKPFGTAMYHSHILNKITAENPDVIQRQITYNTLTFPITDMQKLVAYFNLDTNTIKENNFNDYIEEFNRSLDMMLRNIIWNTKRVRAPYEIVWRELNQLPLVMIGGGSQSILYQNSIKRINKWMTSHVSNRGILNIPSIIPRDLTKDGRPEYLAVAWGLSHRSLDIGDIIPADRIEDIPPLPVADRIYRNDDD